ncbi:MAG TPA: PspA/IM30 family protein [Pirellulales bacterium]|nr:PspA/IM30 family protein [Pirellulales bacterium]
MTLFGRINDILTANLNDLVDRFEDPEKMLRQAVREMDDTIAAATSAAARSIACEKLLGKEIESQHGQASRWQHRAAAAVSAGDDDHARRALMRRREHERLAGVFEEQRAAAEDASARLRRRIDAMKVKRAEAGRMMVALAARQCVAQAYRRLGAHASGDAGRSVLDRFERLRQRVELVESETEALLELAELDESDGWQDREAAAEIAVELTALKGNDRGTPGPIGP